jgi:RNA polymerase sigma factor (sigma-70 family)
LPRLELPAGPSSSSPRTPHRPRLARPLIHGRPAHVVLCAMARDRRSEDASRAAGLSRLGDEDLMALVARGDARAFETIYERHSTVAFSLAYRICGVRAAAEEVAQEAFLAIWRSGARYDRTRGSVRTWLLGIVHHRAIDALRRSTAHELRRSGDERAADEVHARGNRAGVGRAARYRQGQDASRAREDARGPGSRGGSAVIGASSR